MYLLLFWLQHVILYSQAPPKGPSCPYDPRNFNEFYANDYGGYTSAEGGRSKRGMGGGGGRGGMGGGGFGGGGRMGGGGR